MPIRWRTREYERTCDDCGHVWRVPRWAAPGGAPYLSHFGFLRFAVQMVSPEDHVEHRGAAERFARFGDGDSRRWCLACPVVRHAPMVGA